MNPNPLAYRTHILMPSTKHPKPIPQSYWVETNRFLAGQYPASVSGVDTISRTYLAAFIEMGIDSFFDLTRPGELPDYLPLLRDVAENHQKTIAYTRSPIWDKGLPQQDQMAALLDKIDAELRAGRKVYLHCWGGIGRTGTVVGCWLVRHGMTGQEALQQLNMIYQRAEQSRTHPHSPETEEQRQFIMNWIETRR
jgi:protein-tyrosine phosphatase